MSDTNQMQSLSQELQTLSLATKDEKFDTYLNKLGTLPPTDKETKFNEYLDRLDQIFRNEGVSNIKSIRDDYSQTQYQEKEHRKKTIIQQAVLFAEKHQLQHILEQRLDSIITNKIGSGVGGRQLEQVTCANVNVADGIFCEKIGNKLCANCRVIFYCSKECQKTHWKFHKSDCKSDIALKDWRPDYINEGRVPSFLSDENSYISFSSGKPEYLWGNMPAVDIVKFAVNELAGEKSSSDYKDPINLLFAASGDLNDIITSVNGLPIDFNQPVNICINDLSEKVAIRNFIMLYMLAKLGKDAVDAVIQIWYSSALTDKQLIKSIEVFGAIINDKLDPQAENDCTFEFGKLNICTHFNPQAWECLAAMLISRIDLQTAVDTRNQIMMNAERKDYRHRYMQGLTPGERICFYDFRHNGILLPYGALNAHHNVPNKLILDPKYGWTMTDSSDPLSGWDVYSVSQVDNGTANDDFYGKLFFYLREQLGAFVDRLQKFTIKFDLYVEDALKLDQKLKDRQFDRIYVSNISDESYVGIKSVLTTFHPLLNAKNPHATIITLFMNWLPSVPKSHQKKIMRDIFEKRVDKQSPPSSKVQVANFASMVMNKVQTESAALYDHTLEFEEYMKKVGADETAEKVGLRRRKVHKVVPKRIGASMKQDEQDKTLLIKDEREKHLRFDFGFYTFLEHYAEWEVAS